MQADGRAGAEIDGAGCQTSHAGAAGSIATYRPGQQSLSLGAIPADSGLLAQESRGPRAGRRHFERAVPDYLAGVAVHALGRGLLVGVGPLSD